MDGVRKKLQGNTDREVHIRNSMKTDFVADVFQGIPCNFKSSKQVLFNLQHALSQVPD